MRQFDSSSPPSTGDLLDLSGADRSTAYVYPDGSTDLWDPGADPTQLTLASAGQSLLALTGRVRLPVDRAVRITMSAYVEISVTPQAKCCYS